MTPPLKLIAWEDAYNGNHDWTKVSDLPESASPLIVHTVGYEIFRDKGRVTLAMSYYDNGVAARCCDLFTIPVGMIRDEREL